MQLWYSLSYSAMQDALIELHAMRGFAYIAQISDEKPILAFRHLMEKYKLGEQIFSVVKSHLKQLGMAMKRGTIIDTTLIERSQLNQGQGLGTRSIDALNQEGQQMARWDQVPYLHRQ